MLIKKAILYCLLLEFISSSRIFSENNYACLNRVSWYQGNLTNSVICSFNKRPFYFSEVCSQKSSAKKDHDNYSYKSFFVPYAYAYKKNILTHIDKLASEGYQVSFKMVSKPVKGISITVIYDTAKVSLDHNISQVLEPHDIILKFNNKKKLKQIEDGHSSLRWLAMGKHQPRIVLDGNYTKHNARLNKYAYNLIKQLKNRLIKKNTEVFLTCTTPEKTYEDIRINAANLLYQADIFVSLSVSHSYSHQSTIILLMPDSSNFKQKKINSQKLISLVNTQLLSNIQLKKWNITTILSPSCLVSYTEMPSFKIIIPYNFDLEKKHIIIDILYQAIGEYFDLV